MTLRIRHRIVGLLGLALLALLMMGCPPKGEKPAPPGAPEAAEPPEPPESPAMRPHQPPPVASIAQEPTVRVRVMAAARQVRLEAPGGLRVGPPVNQSDVAGARHFASPLTVSRSAQGFILVQASDQALAWELPELEVSSVMGALVQVDGVAYPSRVVLHGHTDGPGGAATLFDVVNHVPLEAYLPGVLHMELYARWHRQTFEAQAVAARSYAIFEASRSRGRHFDLESTTASQAYAGAVSNATATAAARATRGTVLSWEGGVLPAYYSACSGGTGQDAAAAIAGAPDIPPLRGRDHGGWGQACQYFRWEVQRGRGELARRLAAWGSQQKQRGADLRHLRGLREVRISARNELGRPTQFTLVDDTGRRFVMPPESFRFACNAEAPGLPRLGAKELLRSSHVTPRVVGEQVIFSDGRGHGHGVGMCQWGAQNMAASGHPAEQILAFYYPGAALQKAYQ